MSTIPRNEQMVIRPVTIADHEEISALVQRSIQHLLTNDYAPDEIATAARYIKTVEPELIEDGTYYVAEIAGKMVGSGGWSRRHSVHPLKLGEQSVARDPVRDPAAIRAIFVDPAWARRGIGRCIMQRVEAEAQSLRFRSFELMATLTGEPLYHRLGYKVKERTHLAFPNGMQLPAVMMMKRV